jgi:outer membrane protein insertion porin family
MRYWVFLCALLLPFTAFAGTITRIEISGNQRTDPNTIRTYLTLHEGDNATPATLDAAVHALFKSGLFRDVQVAEDNGVLTVTVKENPIINRVAFEGNSEVATDKLKDEIRIAPRSLYTLAKVQDDLDRLYQLYRSKGYFAAKIEPQIIERDQNRVDLIFKITEGPDSGIRRIDFIGNKAFSPDDLRGQIFSVEQAWYNFLTNNDVYDPDRLNADQEKLHRYYNQQGYADFKVTNAIAEFAPDRSGFYLTFTVNEGARYKFGNITIKSEKDGLDIKPLMPLIKSESGRWYNSDKIEDTINALTDHLNRQNYAFLVVDPQVKRNSDTHTIDIQYVLRDGPKVYVQRIDIKGNVRTQDHVIRREFTLAEGDPLNPTKLKQSEQNVKDLNYFKKVDVKTLPGDAPDRKIIEVDVQEQSTGDLSLGGGYSTEDGLLADFGIKERNFLGQGQTVGINATLSQRRQNFDVNYTEPYFDERNVSQRIDLFNTRTDNTDISSYVHEQTGAGTSFSYHLSEYLSQQLGYRLTFDTIKDVPTTASIYVQQQSGSRTISMASEGLTYDRRDRKLDPSQGYIASISTDFAGLGGNTKYIRNVLNVTHYWSLPDDSTIELLGEGGYIYGLNGQDLNINDRFFLGGDTFRGFKYGGVGPHDVSTSDSLGGNEYWRGTLEYTFPVGLDEEGIKAYTFSDAGSVWHLGFTGPTVADSSDPRVSAGVGISWKSPFGPIKVDIADPIIKKSYDDTQLFRLGFGTKF